MISAEAVPFAAAPTIAFRVRGDEPEWRRKPFKAWRFARQILIEASRRHYNPGERDNLHDLFGEPERWSQTVRSLLWTHVSVDCAAIYRNIVSEIAGAVHI